EAETTTVSITLEFIEQSGNLEIIVDWSDTIVQPPRRILFVGNSYTYYNGGIDTHLKNLALSADSDDPIETDRVTFGGYTLEDHWNNSTTLDQIQNGNWDLVILQEQSTRPVNDPELMYEYAGYLDGEITAAGAETGFFMTWAREYDPDMIEDLAAAYNYIGQELDAAVAPVGRAWQRSIQENPGLGLHNSDGSHPNVFGTYLTVCVF
ncbi:MAG: hypothetical protein GY869_13445, partial [Planctomycetes bacterium]|nr:hypothetical protein [Planctomycetota bacterium]